MTTTSVFLGPSLSLTEARAIMPDARFLPPAQAGDVFKEVQRGAKAIAIVDGFFERVPSVWHKEVLYALSTGAHVFGASSMGALRAAELHTFGMVGVGRIFEAYRDGVFEDDDEVAVVHTSAETGFKPISEAMANLRHGLTHAFARGLIGRPCHDSLVAALKRLPYGDRSWAGIPRLATTADLPRAEIDALMAFVALEGPRLNLKRLDAIELLNLVKQSTSAPLPPFRAAFYFEATMYWELLTKGVRVAPTTVNVEVPIGSIRAHLAVVEPDAESIFHGSLLLYLAVNEAKRLGISPGLESVKQTAEHFRRSRGLLTAAATNDWIERNHMSQVEFSALMELLSLLELLLDRHSSGVDAFLPAELQRRSRFSEVAAAIREKRGLLEEFGLSFPSPEDIGTTTDALMRWYQARFRAIDGSFERHYKSRGASDGDRFLRELLAEYLRNKEAIINPLDGPTSRDNRA